MGEERIAIYPGTFDPLTSGHESLIRRGLEVFDTVIVGVARDCGKNPLFTLDERVSIVEEVFKGTPGVKVMPFSGLLVEFAAQNKAKAILRGLRAVSDFDYEFQMALINRKINPELDTMFLTSEHQFTYLSSSMVKELGSYDVDLTDFLPAAIIPDFRKRIEDIRQGGNT